VQQGFDLDLGEERDQSSLEALRRHGEDPGDGGGVLWMPERCVAEQRMDSGEPGIAGPNTVPALLLQVIQKRRHQWCIEVVEVDGRGRLPNALLGEAEQQPPRVPIAGDGLGAGVALPDQSVGEEPLHGGGEHCHRWSP
jgi:hypothetical protein